MKVNLSEVHIDDGVRNAVRSVLDSGWFIHGSKLSKFEKDFARFVSNKFAIGVSSGTSAIHLALTAMNVGRGDRIIVPSHTAFPTVEPILNLGATPLFVDVDPLTYTIDPKIITKSMLRSAKGMLVVHLYGHPADLSPLSEMARANGLFLIEDCAQAAGSMYKGRRVGSFGDLSCFSFYPSKNMTVCGDGGMVVTEDPTLDGKIRLLRNHGMSSKYEHQILGYNYRMSEISAAVGIQQLKLLENANNARRTWAKAYRDLMRTLPVRLPAEKRWGHHVYHLFVIQTKKRDRLVAHLQRKGISTGIHYPIPCHLQPPIPLKLRGHLPHTEKLVSEILSLPMYPQLTQEKVQYVCDAVREFVT